MKNKLIHSLFVLFTAQLLFGCSHMKTGGDMTASKQPVHEKLLYIATVDMGGKDPDFVTVIGVDPDDPETYGKIVHRVDMKYIGDELHHFGYNHDRDFLMVPGLFSGRIYVIDVAKDPKHPEIIAVNEDLVSESGYTVPHTVIGLENGNNLVTMIGADSETTAPGGIVEIHAKSGEFVRAFGPPAERDYKALPLGTDIYVWDWQQRKVIQIENIGPGTGALEVRWLADHDSTIGYTNAPGSNEIWAWEDQDGDGRFNFLPVIKLPEGSVPTDMLLSPDDKYMYISNWMGNNVQQYNIEEPLKPVLTGEVAIPYAQMLRLSPDKTRLYVTNSLLSTWDDTEMPAGVTRNSEYGVFLVNINHENGGMKLNSDFHVDMMHIQKKNTIGPGRPHMMLFDPSVPAIFGHH